MSISPLLSRLAHTSQLAELLPHLHQHALEVSGGSGSMLFEFNPRSGAWHATSACALDELVTEPWIPDGVEKQILEGALCRPAPTFVADLARDLPELLGRLRHPAALLVPLTQAERWVGVLAIGFPSATTFGPTVLADSDISAGFVTVLELSRLRHNDELQRDLQGLLDGLGAELSKTLDLSAALETVCAGARGLFAADRASVWIHDRRSHRLVLEASSDPQHLAHAVGVPTDDPVAPAALVMRRSRADIYPAAPGLPTSTLAVPLRGRRRALGAIVIEGVLTERGDELALLDRADELGGQVASAIENLQLLESVVGSSRGRTAAGANAVLDTSGRRGTREFREPDRSEMLAGLHECLAGVAHELNDPLQSALGHLELLLGSTTLPHAVRRQIQAIYREGARARRVARNVLVVAGARRLTPRAVSLGALLQRVLAQRAAAHRSLQIEVVRHCPETCPRVQGDPSLLHQALLNIVLSAERTIAASGRPGRIDVRISATTDRVAVTVRDSDNGIPDEILPYVFDLFHTKKAMNRVTGFGLAIAYDIVRTHGGELSAANHPDGGAVFRVDLPAGQAGVVTAATKALGE